MESSAAKLDVQTLYMGIVTQAITDITSKNVTLDTIFDVSDFFASDHGKMIMDVLDLDYKTIDANCRIAAKRDMALQFIVYRKQGLSDWPIVRRLRISFRDAARYRKEIDIAEVHLKRERQLREKKARRQLGL